jgi:tRNA threonylcarbamoyladenosine biosynthesis protein TsaB
LRILALESSAAAASVALCEDETLTAQYFQNSGKTHSRTLMPLVESMLRNCDVPLSEVDLVAVAAGPGSFTGLRIGIAAAKGLAWPENKPCCGVSTLEAMAYSLSHMSGVLCPVMDARRSQVYNALFEAEGGGRLRRLSPDRALGLDCLARELANLKKPKILIGDGARLCYNYLTEQGVEAVLAPPHLLLQSAWGVARAAYGQAADGQTVSAAELAAAYLRLPQAERERLKARGEEP